jgi:hypothetical protein
MKIDLGGVEVGNAINAAGYLNPTAKKVSSTYNFVKSLIFSIVLFVIGLILFGVAFLIGLILIGVSLVIFFISLNHKKKINRFLKMREELISTFSPDERVSAIFTDIDYGGVSSVQDGRDEIENVMILTDRRIIFLYVPRVGFDDVTSGNFLQSVGQAMQYNGLMKKVEEQLNTIGISNMIQSSRRVYALNYNEISGIKVNDFFSKVIFLYRGEKYKYFIRKEQLGDFKQIFGNYIIG